MLELHSVRAAQYDSYSEWKLQIIIPTQYYRYTLCELHIVIATGCDSYIVF
jgi:hypothetical protein